MQAITVHRINHKTSETDLLRRPDQTRFAIREIVVVVERIKRLAPSVFPNVPVVTRIFAPWHNEAMRTVHAGRRSNLAISLVLLTGALLVGGCTGISQGPIEAQQGARRTFDKSTEIVAQTFFDRSKIDLEWKRLCLRYRERISNQDDAILALRTVVAKLADPYTGVFGTSDLERDGFPLVGMIDVHANPVPAHDAHENITTLPDVADEYIRSERSESQQKAAISGPTIWVPFQADLAKSPGGCKIAAIWRYGTADLARFEVGDQIVCINGLPVQTFEPQVVWSLLSYRPCTVAIKRHDRNIVLDMRQKEIVQHVQWYLLPKDIFYVSVDDFASLDVGSQTNAAFNSPECAKAKALILDLRHNHGGIFYTGVGVLCEAFGGHPHLCNVRTNAGTQPMYLRTLHDQHGFRNNAVILVDSETGSTAEFVAIAAQRRFGATVVGDRTAGVNTVKQPFEIDPEHVLLVSTARWEFDESGDARGVTPDVSCPISEVDLTYGRGFYRLTHFVFDSKRDMLLDPQLNAAYAQSLRKALANGHK